MEKGIYQKEGIDGGNYHRFTDVLTKKFGAKVVLGRITRESGEDMAYHLPVGLTLRTQYFYSSGKLIATAYGNKKDSKKINDLEDKLVIATHRERID
ncbi:hypothetical protein ACFLZZ_01300 [Nanoarchaeota archaeon]